MNLQIFCILLFLPFALFADDGHRPSDVGDIPSHPLTIGELVDIALTHHPATKVAWWKAQRAAAVVGSAESAYYPHLDASGAVTHGKEFQYINGPTAEFTSYEAGIGLKMLLYDFGHTRASVESAKKALQAAAWGSDWSIQKVLIQVFEASYEALYAQEAYDAALLSLQETEKVFEAARELNRVGLKPIFDVYSAKARLSEAKIGVSEKKAALQIGQAKVTVSLGIQPSCPVRLAPIDIADTPVTTGLVDELITEAQKKRADLLAKQADLEASLLDVEKEENSEWPTFSLFGQGGVEKYTHDTIHSKKHGPGQFNHAIGELSKTGKYSAGIRMDIPLFTGFDTLYKKQQALATARLTQEEMAELQLEISYDITSAHLSLQAAQETLPEAQENLDNAVKAYEGAFERYTAGEGTMVELSDALMHIASARLQYSEIKMQYLTTIAKLAYAAGTLR